MAVGRFPVHVSHQILAKLGVTKQQRLPPMTPQAPITYAAYRATGSSSRTFARQGPDIAPAAALAQQAGKIALVLSELGKLASHGTGPAASDQDQARLAISIDHAHVSPLANEGEADEGLRGGHFAVIQLLVTVRVSFPDVDPSLSPTSAREATPGPAQALVDALNGLVRGKSPASGAQGAGMITSPPGALSPAALVKVQGYIERHLGEKIQLPELAALTRLSVGSFIRAFRLSTGVPPHKYIVQRRVAMAALLIRETRRPLTEIAQEAGFSDQSHLCRSFFQVQRITPGNYRRQFP